jgi:NADPH:quinone reductase
VRALVCPGDGLIGETEVPRPTPPAGQALIRVRAAGLNHADLLMRDKRRRPDSARRRDPIAGGEFAGEVVDLGPDTSGFALGARVMGLGPGFAEYVVVPVGRLLPVPDDVEWAAAGGAAGALLTMYDALARAGRFQSGSRVLFTGATSGIGAVGVRLAAVLGASMIVVTSRSESKLRELLRLVGELACPIEAVPVGPASPLDGRVEDIDVAIDSVGGPSFADLLAAVRVSGHIVQVGRLGGRITSLDLDELARKRIVIEGLTFRTRSAEETERLVADFRQDFAGRLGDVLPVIAARYGWEQATQAYDDLSSSRYVGKIVLLLPEGAKP